MLAEESSDVNRDDRCVTFWVVLMVKGNLDRNLVVRNFDNCKPHRASESVEQRASEVVGLNTADLANELLFELPVTAFCEQAFHNIVDTLR